MRTNDIKQGWAKILGITWRPGLIYPALPFSLTESMWLMGLTAIFVTSKEKRHILHLTALKKAAAVYPGSKYSSSLGEDV
jgi:hypothetical protein